MEIEIDVLDLAATLAAQRGHPTSEYILCPARLSSFSPENRLRLLQAHRSKLKTRLVPDSASVQQPQTDQQSQLSQHNPQNQPLPPPDAALQCPSAARPGADQILQKSKSPKSDAEDRDPAMKGLVDHRHLRSAPKKNPSIDRSLLSLYSK